MTGAVRSHSRSLLQGRALGSQPFRFPGLTHVAPRSRQSSSPAKGPCGGTRVGTSPPWGATLGVCRERATSQCSRNSAGT